MIFDSKDYTEQMNCQQPNRKKNEYKKSIYLSVVEREPKKEKPRNFIECVDFH